MDHIPVLLNETIDMLDIHDGDTVVDATLGAGGHSSFVVSKFGRNVKMVGFDLDGGALEKAQDQLKRLNADFVPIKANFRNMFDECLNHGILKAERIMFDLGVSSMEIGQSGRGFSFRFDEPLIMTLSDDLNGDSITAADILNGYKEEELVEILFKFGEERFARKIAHAIVMARRVKKFETTFELVDVVKDAVPAFYRNGRINPATKTFQALRITVNQELDVVREGILSAWKLLSPGGRIAVISFHSLEDRIVKNTFKEISKDNAILITKKPIVPTRKEVIENPRSRSAKLRVIQKI